MCRSGSTYSPDPFEVMTVFWPVSLLVATIFTFGTTEPDGSLTVPTIVASWANTGSKLLSRKVASSAKNNNVRGHLLGTADKGMKRLLKASWGKCRPPTDTIEHCSSV